MQEKKRFLASTFSGYRAAMLRQLALAYWIPAIAVAVLFGAHWFWWARDDKHHGEVITGFGAALIVLGVVIAARPYIRSGLRSQIKKAAGDPPRTLPWLRHVRWQLPKVVEEMVAQSQYAKRRQAAMRDAWDERVVAVMFVGVGTMLNGYGSPLVRWLGLEG